MAAKRLKFGEWQFIHAEDPQQGVAHFMGKLDGLNEEQRSALVASTPDPEDLVRDIFDASMDREKPLSGVPYMLQDLIDVCDFKTECGTPFGDAFDAPLDTSSLLYQKLSELGASFFGKNTPAEFGISSQGLNARQGNCPHTMGDEYPGGGGAGSCAYAVAQGWVPLAFGLDTLGGIRIPAALNGLFGFRMGNNSYAREGVFPIASTLDSIGWVTAHLEDLITSFKAFYPERPQPQEAPAPQGYVLSHLNCELDPEIKAGLLQLSAHLNVATDLPNQIRLNEIFRQCESALELIVNRQLHSLHHYWLEEYAEQYSTELRNRIEAGQSYRVPQINLANATQRTLRMELLQFLDKFDYLMLPITPRPTPSTTEWDESFVSGMNHLVAPASLAFLPAILLPFSCEEGGHGAAQLLIHPKKLHRVPEILAQVQAYYQSTELAEEEFPEKIEFDESVDDIPWL